MGKCQSKQCVHAGCCNAGGGADDPLPPLSITSKTHSNLTLIKLKRDQVQPLIPDGMYLAPTEALSKYYPSIGEDEFVVGLQMDDNKGFGPVIGPFGHLNFEMFMVIIPFCILDEPCPKIQGEFWTFRRVMASSSWIAEVLTSIGYGASFLEASINFSSDAEGGTYKVEGANMKESIQVGTSWNAAQDFHIPTNDDKEEPGMKLILALLTQPWSADEKLRKGSYYEVDIDTIQYRKCENVKIHLNISDLPDLPSDFYGSVLASAEVKIPELRESLPFIINGDHQQAPKGIEDHINKDGNIDFVLTPAGCKHLLKIQHLCNESLGMDVDDITEPSKEEELLAEIHSFIGAEAKGHFKLWDHLTLNYMGDIKSNKFLASSEYSSFPLGKMLQRILKTRSQTLENDPASFTNQGGNVTFTPESIKTAYTFEDITETLLEAIANKQIVKAIGTGHSYSLCLETGGYLLKTSGTLKAVANLKTPITGQLSADMLCDPYKGILQIDGADLIYPKHTYNIDTVDSNLALFECEAGITIYQLIHALQVNNLGLQNMGGAAWQTLAGYCSTSTHGSGVNFGPVAEGIKSLVLVTTGEFIQQDWKGSPLRIKHASGDNNNGIFVYRIESYDGITHFDSYDDPQISLLQCDDVFDAVRTSFGAFGIIYSITLLVQQFYWLKQKVIGGAEVTYNSLLENQLAPDQSNDANFPAGLKNPRNSMFYWSPYSQTPYKDQQSGKSSPHSVLWFETELAEKPFGFKFKTRKDRASFENQSMHLQGSTRPTISNFVTKNVQVEDLFKASPVQGLLTEIEKLILYVIQQLQITYDLTAILFKYVPRLTPFLANSAMQTQLLEGNKTGTYYHVMMLNVAQNAGFATEYALPLQEPKSDSFIDPKIIRTMLSGRGPYEIWPFSIEKAGNYTIQNVTNCLNVISNQARTAVATNKNYFTSPMGVRFVENSTMPVSMMYGSDSCTIELDMAYGTPNGFETLENIGPRILQVGGRFHWGLSIKEGQSELSLLQQAYPKLETWRNVANQFNCKETFSNDFLIALGLTK